MLNKMKKIIISKMKMIIIDLMKIQMMKMKIMKKVIHHLLQYAPVIKIIIYLLALLHKELIQLVNIV